jgi:glycosyltransferase involved in cell wall biosynthesis
VRSLLWIGDAAVASGFARATHYTLETLRQTWDVSVLGINYQGDPHRYPYDIYPCFPGGDLFGLGRVVPLIKKIRPDVIVVQNDPWNIPAYLAKTGNVPVIGAIAVDGKNCAGRGLNGLALAIFWTKFGENEAKLGGYSGPSAVVPLGVDLNIYKPQDRLSARRTMGFPSELDEAFIIGNVNRNQPRKRLDLCISYFAEWIKSRQINDAYFFFHTAPTGDQGYDVSQLAKYYGIANRLVLAEPEIGQGVSELALVKTYNTFDVMLTTTQGEGFGLPTFEGMACGIPQIVPNWAALEELCEDAAIKVPCSSIACTPNKINVIGGIADRNETIEAMDSLYNSVELRKEYRKKGLELVANPRYRWENVGQKFAEAMEEALYPEMLKDSK